MRIRETDDNLHKIFEFKTFSSRWTSVLEEKKWFYFVCFESLAFARDNHTSL